MSARESLFHARPLTGPSAMQQRGLSGPTRGTRCPRVEFDCGHVAFIWPAEYGDGSAWCQACGQFRCYDRCPECLAFDCNHRETR